MFLKKLNQHKSNINNQNKLFLLYKTKKNFLINVLIFGAIAFLSTILLVTSLSFNYTLAKNQNTSVLGTKFTYSDIGICYYVNNEDKENNTILHTNSQGELKTVNQIATKSDIQAITWNYELDKIYVASKDQLGLIDKKSEIFQLIGGFGSGYGTLGSKNLNNVNTVAYNPFDKKLYAISGSDEGKNLLFQVNNENGSVVKNTFGSGMDYIETDQTAAKGKISNMVFHPQTGELYSILNISDAHKKGANLVKIDLQTGNIRTVGNIDIENIVGLTITLEGKILIITGNIGKDKSTLFELDINSFKIKTEKSQKLTIGSNITGIACTSKPPENQTLINSKSKQKVTQKLILVDDEYIWNGKNMTLDVLDNDKTVDCNCDLNTETLKVINQPEFGEAKVSNGKIAFTTLDKLTKEVGFEYEICDQKGLCEKAKITIKPSDSWSFINLENNNLLIESQAANYTKQQPITKMTISETDSSENIQISPVINKVEALDDNITSQINQTINIDASKNDIVDGGIGKTTITVNPKNGKSEITGLLIKYTPNNGYLGTDKLEYKICNLQNYCEMATVNITIKPQAIILEDFIEEFKSINNKNYVLSAVLLVLIIYFGYKALKLVKS